MGDLLVSLYWRCARISWWISRRITISWNRMWCECGDSLDTYQEFKARKYQMCQVMDDNNEHE
jgi:hypothetical protein